jgi:hypothetical protein
MATARLTVTVDEDDDRLEFTAEFDPSLENHQLGDPLPACHKVLLHIIEDIRRLGDGQKDNPQKTNGAEPAPNQGRNTRRRKRNRPRSKRR